MNTMIIPTKKNKASIFVKRAMCLSLAAASLFAASCGKNEPEQTGEPSSTEAIITTEPAPEFLEIVKDGASKFVIVRPDENDACTQDALAFKKLLKKRVGLELDLSTDFSTPSYPGSKNGPEILIGACDRDETREFIDSLEENEYGFAVIGDKLVIAGKNDSLTAMALSSFDARYMFNKDFVSDKSMKLPTGLSEKYKTSELTLSKIMNSPLGVIATFKRFKNIAAHGDFHGTQGSATDGKYFYVTLHKKTSAGVETNKIVKIDIGTNKEVMLGPELPTDHHNDMCYDSLRNRLVAPNMNGTLISIIDPETLELKETVNATWLGGTPWAIAYNEARDRYVIAAGGAINICDGDFKVVQKISFHSEPNYTGQGMDCDDDYIYMPLSTAAGKSTDNIIVVYSWTDGYVRTVHMNTSWESETMMNYDGIRYVTFNGGGAVSIARVDYVLVYNG
ncbi:MAG: hypothetical protein MJ137_00465 [Clostridia bacterium]|nr:hypothetical protein [Clostridia bacterium]